MLHIKIIAALCKPGRFGQWISAITVSLCALTAGLGFAWPSGALPKIRSGEAGFTLDRNEQSWAVSALFFGNVFSPIPSALMMEHLGRRNCLCLGVWMHFAAFVIISTMGGFWPVVVSRILTGFWAGLVYTVVPVYLGETAEPRIRGTLGTFFGISLYVGSLIVSFIGSYFSYIALSLASAAMTAALGVFLCLIPESPYFYLSKGDVESARASLSWLRGYCDDTVLNTIEDSIRKQMKNNPSLKDIIKKPSNRKAFIIAQLLGTIQRMSGLAILLTYTSIIVPDYFVSAEEFGIVLNGVWIFACIGTTFIMDRFGRRTLMVISCTGSSVTMLGVAVWFYLRDKTVVDVETNFKWVPFAMLILHGITYSLGLVSIPTMIPGEMFSTAIKSKATSLVTVWVALVSGFITNIFLPIESLTGTYTNFVICSLASFFGILTSLFYMVETKGKSLEEIQDELEGINKKTSVIESTRF